MNKEFIPYEQALELKELGFDDYSQYYVEDGMVINILWQQAFRWFRDKKLSDSCVCRYQGKNDGGVYYYYVITKDFGVEETRHFKEGFSTYEEAELACLKQLIEIVKNK